MSVRREETGQQMVKSWQCLRGTTPIFERKVDNSGEKLAVTTWNYSVTCYFIMFLLFVFSLWTEEINIVLRMHCS